MRLFQRTLLSFIGIILLQGVFTIFFVGYRIRKDQTQEIWRELGDESHKVFDNLNSWKRLLWKNTIELQESSALQSMLAREYTISLSSELAHFLEQTVQASGADFLLIRRGPFSKYFVVDRTQLSLPDETYFNNDRGHPYIDTVVINNSLYFVGTVRIPGKYTSTGRQPDTDFFLIKLISSSLLSQLSFNPRIQILLSVNGSFSVGTEPLPALMDWFKTNALSSAYKVIDALQQKSESFSVIVQQSGMARFYPDASFGSEEQPLYISTLYDRNEYLNRLSSINRTVLTVSLVSALLTLLLSMALARSITHPIQQLRKGMLLIKGGIFPGAIELKVSGEMGDLLQGFNEMALQLAENHESLQQHIAEIVRLKDYNDKLFNAMQEAILVVNSLFIVEKTNKAFLTCFNVTIESVHNKNIDDLSIELFDESLHSSIRAILFGALTQDTQIRRASGSRTFEIKLYPLNEVSRNPADQCHCILIISDISQRIAMEERLFQAEKLRSISMLSAGVAHEINNPLSSILTNVQNRIELTSDPEALQDLHIIEQETKRIARIVRNLLDFTSSHSAEQEQVSVNEVVTDVLRLIAYSIKKESHIEIKADLADELPLISVGKDELKQILINLITNSLQAIAQNGIISISTSVLPEKKLVHLAVQDTGCGMEPEILQRIFDPFFTTKGASGNTGLGLSVVYGIVSKYRGTIEAESIPGQGTCMHIYFPQSQNTERSGCADA